MNFEFLNLNESSSRTELKNYGALTPLAVTKNTNNCNINSGDAGSEACDIREHKATPCINNVKLINDFTSTDTFSCDMTIREKLNWLEKKILGLKNIVDGNEIWMLSKDGHAMKVKCLLTTNELPECKGYGVPSTIKFLRQMKKSLIAAGVTEDDWVTLASSRLRGNLRAAWEIKSKGSPNMNWSEFTDFIVNQAYRKKKIKDGDEQRVMKKGNFCIEDYLLKNKQEND